MQRIAVLGAGMVGRAIARDLALDPDIQLTACDRDPSALARLPTLPTISPKQVDLRDEAVVHQLAAAHDLVVGALPGALGFAAVRAALSAGRPVVDIAFQPEDPAPFDALARAHQIPCLVDFGVAPGCSHLIFGNARARLAAMEAFTCYVGGLPVEREWPWEYRAPFSPVDVLEEYTRPARSIENGTVVVREALSDPELLHFPGIGSLEAFLTDGLRTLLAYTDVPTMVEKTCRYPGHRDKLLLLKTMGLLDARPIDVDGTAVSPLAFTGALLKRDWTLPDAMADLTVMRIVIRGRDHAGHAILETWDLDDRADPTTQTSSMARTTGYTCTAGVRLVLSGRLREVGLLTPEAVGANQEWFDFIFDHLAARGVCFHRTRSDSAARH